MEHGLHDEALQKPIEPKKIWRFKKALYNLFVKVFLIPATIIHYVVYIIYESVNFTYYELSGKPRMITVQETGYVVPPVHLGGVQLPSVLTNGLGLAKTIYPGGIKKPGSDELIYSTSEEIRRNRPYSVIIENDSNKEKNAILFGKNIFFHKHNFGSDKGLKLKVNDYTEYSHLMSESGERPFTTSLIRVRSEKTSQVVKDMVWNEKDASGFCVTDPIYTEAYFSAYQFQDTICDIPFRMDINSNTFIKYKVLPKTIVRLTFFREEQITRKREVMSARSLKAHKWKSDLERKSKLIKTLKVAFSLITWSSLSLYLTGIITI